MYSRNARGFKMRFKLGDVIINDGVECEVVGFHYSCYITRVICGSVNTFIITEGYIKTYKLRNMNICSGMAGRDCSYLNEHNFAEKKILKDLK